MLDYEKRLEETEKAKKERAAAARKSARARKTPEKFVAGPASIFLEKLTPDERKRRREEENEAV